MMLDIECSFCPRVLDLSPALAELIAVTAVGITVGEIPVDGWRVYLAGTTEPTVICDRCLPVYDVAASLFSAGIDQVLEHHASRR